MTDNLLERVALAIEAAELTWKANTGGDSASCVDCPNDVKARAAIEAMREPSAKMVEVAENFDGDRAQRGYREMIDAALKPDPS